MCYKQQEVLTIHNPEKTQIKAYFNQNAAKYITEGTIVQVNFPDGKKTKGRINHSYIATYALPSEFQKKYEPTERNLLVDIVPIDKNTEELWKNFYLMDVELVINKIKF